MKNQQDFYTKHMHLLIVALLPLQLFVLTPSALYLANISEMNVGLGAVIKNSLIPALLSIVCFIVIFKLCNARLKTYWLLLLCCLTLLVWLQGDVILWDYGVMDGRNIDWQKNRWQAWVDLSVWVAILVIGLGIMKSRLKLIAGLSIAVVFIQASTVLVQIAVNFDQIAPKNKYDSQQDLLKIHQFSKEKNVLHLIVDGFQADVFDFLVNNEHIGPSYRKAFSGFTFYKENLGVFPYTRFSVPSFLGGKIYKNQTVKNEFINNILAGDNILNHAKDNGFALDIASGANYWVNRYANSRYDHIYNLDTDVSINPAHKQTAKLIDMALFRSLPQFIKPYIYNQQNWLLTALFLGKQRLNHWYFKHTRFLESLISNMDDSREQPVYKYIHIMNTHNPMVVDANCEYIGKVVGMSREALTFQSKCTMDTLSLFLQRLKQLGIYDSSLIIIHGDHGGWPGNYRQGPAIKFSMGQNGSEIKLSNGQKSLEWIKSLASPMLVIKKPYAKGELHISEQLTSLIQLPDTVNEIMSWQHDYGYPSIYATIEQQAEKRNFYFYPWQRDAWETDYTTPIAEFEITGSHYDTEWKQSDFYFPPKGKKK